MISVSFLCKLTSIVSQTSRSIRKCFMKNRLNKITPKKVYLKKRKGKKRKNRGFNKTCTRTPSLTLDHAVNKYTFQANITLSVAFEIFLEKHRSVHPFTLNKHSFVSLLLFVSPASESPVNIKTKTGETIEPFLPVGYYHLSI